MRPTVRQLEYMIAVADHLHFRRAARACAVSQPALSAQILQLEELLGVRLFERDRRRVLLTAAGEDIVARARRILAQLDALSEVARGAAAPLTGRLHLGVIPTIAPYLLPRVLPALRRAYPRLQMILREDQTARLVDQLASGALDVLLLALPVAADFVEAMPLFDEPFVLAVPGDHPLARQPRVVESDLRDHPVMLLEDGHCLRDQALAICAAAGAREPAELCATSLSTLVQMVAGGLGITLLPEMAVAVEAPAADGIALRAFAATPPTRRIGLVWRASSARHAELRLLGEELARARPTTGPLQPPRAALRRGGGAARSKI